MMRDVGLIGIAGALLWRRQARWAIHVTLAARQEGRQEGNRGEEDDKLRLRGDRGGGHGGGGNVRVREGPVGRWRASRGRKRSVRTVPRLYLTPHRGRVACV